MNREVLSRRQFIFPKKLLNEKLQRSQAARCNYLRSFAPLKLC